MAWEFLQNHMFKDCLITWWNYLFSGNAQLSRQVPGLIKASFNNVVVNFKWFLLLYVIFGMLFYFFFYEIMKTFFKFLIFLLLTNVVVLSRLTKFGTTFIRKGKGVGGIAEMLTIPYRAGVGGLFWIILKKEIKGKRLHDFGVVCSVY